MIIALRKYTKSYKHNYKNLQFSVFSPHLATSLHIKAFFQNASNLVFLFCHSRKAQPQAGTFFVIPAQAQPEAGTPSLTTTFSTGTFMLSYRIN